jgi:hypothetical protein
MGHGPRSLQRAARRRAPVAFWHFGRDHLVVAELRAGEDEPLLLACAAVRAEWVGAMRAGEALSPGLLELLRRGVTGARLHAAAIAADDDSAADDAVEIEESGRRLRVSRARIDHVVELFVAARLPLVALAHEASARDHLGRFFGPTGGKRAGDRSLADDPLAAVSVTPACEPAAAALGSLLAVPVGLALASFGVSEDA